MTFGSRLKQARQRKHLTQEMVAKRIGIDATTISKYENDKSQPDNEILKLLADLYGASIDWLMTGSMSYRQDSRINRLIIDGEQEELSPDEAGHLKENLEMYRLLQEKRAKSSQEN